MIPIEYFNKTFEDRLKQYREASDRREKFRCETSQFYELQKKFSKFIGVLGSDQNLDWYKSAEIEEAAKSFPTGKKLFLVGGIPFDWAYATEKDDYYTVTTPLIYAIYSPFAAVEEKKLYFNFGMEMFLSNDKVEVTFAEETKDEKFSLPDAHFAYAEELTERIKKNPKLKNDRYEISDILFGDADYLHYDIFDIDKDISCLIVPRNDSMFSTIESALTETYPGAVKFGINNDPN